VDPGAEVRQITFFADGRVVCVDEQPPFECSWDAGPGVREHSIRATAILASGQRVVQTVRTRNAAFAENVNVDAVQVTATVTTSGGRFVGGLPQEAFRIRENGVEQQVTAFANEHIPLELVVALDVSQSMTPAIPVLKTAARAFLGALQPTDQVTLLAFNDNIFTLARRSTDPAIRVKAVDRLAPWGGTALYDAILTALNIVGRQPGRRALVVFSDGEDQSSVASVQSVRERLERSDATVYTIGLGRGSREAGLKEILERLAVPSGGRAFMTERIERLERDFSQILEELSSQYLLAYLPANEKHDGTWRKIEVEVTGGDYQVRARQGYRAAGPSRR
jgi:Ca-activated chloride channel family protein